MVNSKCDESMARSAWEIHMEPTITWGSEFTIGYEMLVVSPTCHRLPPFRGFYCHG